MFRKSTRRKAQNMTKSSKRKAKNNVAYRWREEEIKMIHEFLADKDHFARYRSCYDVDTLLEDLGRIEVKNEMTPKETRRALMRKIGRILDRCRRCAQDSCFKQKLPKSEADVLEKIYKNLSDYGRKSAAVIKSEHSNLDDRSRENTHPSVETTQMIDQIDTCLAMQRTLASEVLNELKYLRKKCVDIETMLEDT